MRIDLRFDNLQSVQPRKSTHERTAATERSPERQDEAKLSSGSSNVASLSAKAMAEPDVRADRVSGLRAAVGDGSYPVEPQKIADAMFKDIF
jgi:flagellar biosynthesis anti-sigma factor FlgM